MPVLLLAIVFEQRLFRRRGIPLVLLSVTSTVVIGAFVVAEAVSLRVLFRGYAHRQDQIWVIAPMLVGAALLIAPIGLPPLLELERSGKRFQSKLAQAVAGVLVVSLLLVLFNQ